MYFVYINTKQVWTSLKNKVVLSWKTWKITVKLLYKLCKAVKQKTKSMCHCPETNACVMHGFHSPTRHVMSLCDALRDNLRECESITFNKNRSSQREQTSTETEFLHSFKLRTTRLQNLVVSSVTRVPTFHRMS